MKQGEKCLVEYSVIDFLLELVNDEDERKILELVKKDASKEEILDELLKDEEKK